jgi:hypothetical protein
MPCLPYLGEPSDQQHGEIAYRPQRTAARVAAPIASPSCSPKSGPSSTAPPPHAGKVFAYQHDPEAIGHHEYTLFDDESGGNGSYLLRDSRVVTVRLDLAAKAATLVKSVRQPEGLLATELGNAQTTRNGDLFCRVG